LVRGIEPCIIARTSNDPILRTSYRRFVASIRRVEALDTGDIDVCIRETRSKNDADEFVVCPTSEYFNLYVLENIDFFHRHHCTIPLVNLDLYRAVSDKHSFSGICQEQGISVPKRLTLENQVGFPLVAKPYVNVTSDKKSLYPHIIRCSRDLSCFLEKEDSSNFYYEEFVSGRSYYLLYYIPQSGEHTAFSQQNLLQQPGGKSILLATAARVHEHPLAGKFVEILTKLDFHGLAMIEVIQKGQDYVFIELNPRFWGPFQLLLNSGSPIIHRYIEDNLGLPPFPVQERPIQSYLWLGGIAESLSAGKELVWHIPLPPNQWMYIGRHLRNDVYFHRDSLGLFCHELVYATQKWLQGCR
jgi:predicted ATP-grasp superfamily ATP-dependent carboligase